MRRAMREPEPAMNEPMSDAAIRADRRSNGRIAPDGRRWSVAVFAVIALIGFTFGPAIVGR